MGTSHEILSTFVMLTAVCYVAGQQSKWNPFLGCHGNFQRFYTVDCYM